MNRAEFDKVADEYRSMHATNIAASGEGPDYFADYKIRDIAHDFGQRERASTDVPAVLDFGAGIGNSIPFVHAHLPGARLTCLDVSRRSIDLARERFPGQAEFVVFDGEGIPFPEASFDIVVAACVFHRIDHAEHVRCIGELRRVLRPGGMAFIFEHNPYNPLTVRAVNTCPFDENARLIAPSAMRRAFLKAGFGGARVKYRIFFPGFLRAFRPLEPSLTWLPLGAQYYVSAVK